MIFNILGLKLIKFIIDMLPEFGINLGFISAFNTVSNIFAWINYFIPTEVIAALLGITAAYYGFILMYKLFKAFKDIIL